MDESEKKSDWEDLARQLGATIPDPTEAESASGTPDTGESPAGEASAGDAPGEVAPPPRVALPATPPQAAPGDWDALVSDLGVAPSEPAAEPPQADERDSSADSDSEPRDDPPDDAPYSLFPDPTVNPDATNPDATSTDPTDTESGSATHLDAGDEFGSAAPPADELPGAETDDDSWGLKSRGAPRETDTTPPEREILSAWGTPAKADEEVGPSPGESAQEDNDDDEDSGGTASSAVKLWHSIFGRPKESASWDEPSAPQGSEPASREPASRGEYDEPSGTATDADQDAQQESGARESIDGGEETTDRARRPRRRSRSRRRRRGSSDAPARSESDRDPGRAADGLSGDSGDEAARDLDDDLIDSDGAEQDTDGDADQSDRGRRRVRSRRTARGEHDVKSDAESDAESDDESDDDLDRELDEEDSEDESDDARPRVKTARRPAVHRNIPSWEEAVGTIVESNMQTRTTRKPSSTRSGSGSGRGRPRGRRRRS